MFLVIAQMTALTLKLTKILKLDNNPTIASKYSLEVLFRASNNIPHHYPKCYVDLRFWYFEYCARRLSYANSIGFSGFSV